MDPSMNIPQMGASMLMNNYQNYFVGFPQGPTLSEPIVWNNDNVIGFLGCNGTIPCELAPIAFVKLRALLCLITLLNTPVVHHIYREQNFLADKLEGMAALLVQTQGCSLQLFDRPPDFVMDILQADIA